jgi:predicted esterase
MPPKTLQAFHPFWRPAPRPGAPVLVLLHGTGGDERQLVPLAERILDGRPASLLGLRGRVLEGGAVNRWFRRLREGVFDEDSVAAHAADLAEALGAAGGEYGFDPAQALALGYSNGANIAAALMLLHPGVLRGAAMLRPVVPLTPETQPELSGKRALLVAGRRDTVCPPESARELASLLKSAGAEVEREEVAAGHELTEADVAAVRGWLDRTLAAGRPGPESA